MKKTFILTIALLLTLTNINAQTSVKKQPIKKPAKETVIIKKYSLKDTVNIPSMTDLIAVKTPNADTLFIINNEIGKSIEEIWRKDKNLKSKPVIIYMDLAHLKEKLRYYSKK